jgi:hypothetical protein
MCGGLLLGSSAATDICDVSHTCLLAPTAPCCPVHVCRLLQRELMGPARPIDRSRTRLSAFTLAALEDTGW